MVGMDREGLECWRAGVWDPLITEHTSTTLPEVYFIERLVGKCYDEAPQIKTADRG